jgi:hypothetical protein
VALLNRKSPEEKAAEEQARLEARAGEEAVRTAAAERLAAHAATLQKWEYHVETIDLTAHWTKTMQGRGHSVDAGQNQCARGRGLGDDLVRVDPDVRLLLQ